MNFVKKILSISLIGLSMQAFAEPIALEFSDKTVNYDSEDLKVLKIPIIEQLLIDYPVWNGYVVPNKEKKAQLPLIDAKTFAFMVKLAKKDDAALFNFIDSLDQQAFRLICFYTQVIEENRIAEFLKYKMLKDPELQKIAETRKDIIEAFIRYKSWIRPNDGSGMLENISIKYLGKEISNYSYNDGYNQANYQIFGLLALVHLYHETLKKPLPINTDHLIKMFNAQTHEIKQTLLTKNLVTVS
jgi:hypothetical protein